MLACPTVHSGNSEKMDIVMIKARIKDNLFSPFTTSRRTNLITSWHDIDIEVQETSCIRVVATLIAIFSQLVHALHHLNIKL